MDIAFYAAVIFLIIMFLSSLFSDDGDISELPEPTKIVIYIDSMTNVSTYHANIGDIVYIDSAYYIKSDKGFMRLNNKQLDNIEKVYNMRIE